MYSSVSSKEQKTTPTNISQTCTKQNKKYTIDKKNMIRLYTVVPLFIRLTNMGKKLNICGLEVVLYLLCSVRVVTVASFYCSCSGPITLLLRLINVFSELNANKDAE